MISIIVGHLRCCGSLGLDASGPSNTFGLTDFKEARDIPSVTWLGAINSSATEDSAESAAATSSIPASKGKQTLEVMDKPW
jgi:hypothetical protein